MIPLVGCVFMVDVKDVPSVALLIFYLIYILPYSKASNWPPKLIMQLIPQNLLVSLQV